MLSPAPTGRSTLVSVPPREGTKQSGSSTSDRHKLLCDYCSRPHHTRETCQSLNGRPSGGRGGSSGSCGGRFEGRGRTARAHHTVVTDTTASITSDSAPPSDVNPLSAIELETLQHLMTHCSSSTSTRPHHSLPCCVNQSQLQVHYFLVPPFHGLSILGAQIICHPMIFSLIISPSRSGQSQNS